MTVPAVERTSPLRTPSRVDLPAPLAPTSATSSAGPTSMSIPNSTGPASKPAVSPRTLSSGSGLDSFGIAVAQVGLDHPLVTQHDLRLPPGQDLAARQNCSLAADAHVDAADA